VLAVKRVVDPRGLPDGSGRLFMPAFLLDFTAGGDTVVDSDEVS
jgi:hypothetical protein